MTENLTVKALIDSIAADPVPDQELRAEYARQSTQAAGAKDVLE